MSHQSFLSLLISIALFCILDCSATAESSDDLVLLHLLYRHGDRSPTQSYPKDPHQEDAWPQGFGQLSLEGMNQHFKLGQYLHNRYIGGSPYKLLDSNYSRYQIKIRSTDVDRTLMSAYSNLAGFFPPGSSQMWNPQLDWQPIPVHTVPQYLDSMLNMDVECPRYTEEYKKVLASDRVQQIKKQNKDFFDYLIDKTGYTDVTVESVWDIYDTLFCEQQHGFGLPDWANRTWANTSETVFEKLHQLNALSFELEFNQPTVKRYRGGVLLKEIVEHMNSLSLGSFNETTKCFVYSAHDSTVAALTSAMNVFNNISPPYASLVMVELLKNGGEYFVKVQYRNDSVMNINTTRLYTLKIPGCEERCPLKNFTSLLSGNIPDDWHAECFGHDIDNWLRDNGIILAGVGIGCLILCLIVIIAMILIYRRRYHRYSRLDRPIA